MPTREEEMESMVNFDKPTPGSVVKSIETRLEFAKVAVTLGEARDRILYLSTGRLTGSWEELVPITSHISEEIDKLLEFASK
jgi:hypothetical protein